MNTRQKLTLGIAAIFMVTLTVIGVTYAYFVTRVNYSDGTAQATIQTAKIGAFYKDDTAIVTLTDILPGASVYKTFTVNNDSLVNVPFSITLATKLNKDGEGNTLPQFIHTAKTGDTLTSDLVTECYVSTSIAGDAAGALTDANSDCYDSNYYNNIKVTLYRIPNYVGTDATKPDYEEFLAYDLNSVGTNGVTEEGATEEDLANINTAMTFETLTATYGVENITTDVDGDLVSLNAPFDDLKDPSGNYTAKNTETENVFKISLNKNGGRTQETLNAKASEEADTVSNYYVMKVDYINVNKNQNIENNASVSLRIDIQAESITN